ESYAAIRSSDQRGLFAVDRCSSRSSLEDRAHFFGVAARLMRQILVDFAHARAYQKRGGGALQVSLDDAMAIGGKKQEDLLALDEALRALAMIDDRKSQVVELRFYGGLTEEEDCMPSFGPCLRSCMREPVGNRVMQYGCKG